MRGRIRAHGQLSPGEEGPAATRKLRLQLREAPREQVAIEHVHDVLTLRLAQRGGLVQLARVRTAWQRVAVEYRVERSLNVLKALHSPVDIQLERG